ncbi:MAG: glycosyltransferase [Bacteroidota bacterium]
MKKPTPEKVAVFMITYNHEGFIAQAVESVMMQETNFSYKLYIGEDFSNDDTRNICIQLKEKYPEKIELILHEKNIGLFANEKIIYNLCFNSGAQYIANLEGDDYWIDPLKLQKQVDFLDENPDFSASYTNSYVINEETGEKVIAKTQIWDVAETKDLLEHDDFHKDNIPLSPGHTSTFVFRNNVIKAYPDWFYQVYVGDFPMFIIASKYGKAKFLNEITSVYRVHENGISSKNFHFESHTKERIFIYQKLNEYLEKKHAKQINTLIAKHYINLLKLYKKNKKITSSINALFQIMYYDFKLLKNII